MTGKEFADSICAALYDKKGEDILIVDVAELTIVAEYFVICTGRSPIHVKSLDDSLEEKMKENDIRATRIDGYKEGRWIAMDYGNVIVHIFSNQERLFYNLEKLWSNGSNVVSYNPEQ
jgi:ribosome-associated protein